MIMVHNYFCSNIPVSSQVSPIKPAAQLQVSLATQAPFTHGGSHITGRNLIYRQIPRVHIPADADMDLKDSCSYNVV